MIYLSIKAPNITELKLPAGVEALVDCARASNCLTLGKHHNLEKRDDGLYLIIRNPKKVK